MGREIKFRAWDLFEAKKMYEVESMNFYKMTVTCNGFEELMADHVIMQYTGLKDKNGKEIYEGDIIMPHGHGGARGRVAIASDAGPCLGMNAGWYIVYRGDWESYTALECSDEHEVIGNIYENPELLETSDEK